MTPTPIYDDLLRELEADLLLNHDTDAAAESTDDESAPAGD
ncbi:hypothetical protein [Solihabitans fulvus]|nr:hypothetical protein [Solihabitans fulvus]